MSHMPEAPADAAPPVSVVMPVRDEERHLADAVACVLGQDYPGELELVLAVGPSRDGTAEVAERLAAAEPRITVVANPPGRRPCGLNAAIKASRHSIVARVDGHALLPRGYLSSAVRALAETGADDVGGIMAAEGVTPFQQAVAWAMRSPFGVGASRFHTGGEPGPADTVYLGVYRRAAIERVGGYDESFHIAEDWELNHRIRLAGGLIWFLPELEVTYRPRASVRELARQYFGYGRWRRAVARQHHGTINPRYLAPPAAVLVITAGTLAGLAGAVGMASGAAGSWLALLTAGFALPLLYGAGIVAVAASAAARGLAPRVAARLPAALATMHVSWGTGFLTSPASLAVRTGPPHVR
jgi:succinoglycan biosynthesis protein ExoA